ncbi:hypothetical protein TNCV_3979661 [Trichonephila clavipes]|nr:hypothetical protein TNCV_3979661 [Trichonephila clavipes]
MCTCWSKTCFLPSRIQSKCALVGVRRVSYPLGYDQNHATRNCLIKERQENPFCINCQDYGHSACYTKCPKFPEPKKGTPFADPKKKRNFSKREFPSLTLLAEKSPIRLLSKTKKKIPSVDSLVKIIIIPLT